MGGCPASGKSCADELAEISTALNEKYKDALDKWCTENIDTADIIVGQGGEVVMLNMDLLRLHCGFGPLHDLTNAFFTRSKRILRNLLLLFFLGFWMLQVTPC